MNSPFEDQEPKLPYREVTESITIPSPQWEEMIAALRAAKGFINYTWIEHGPSEFTGEIDAAELTLSALDRVKQIDECCGGPL